MKNLIIIYTALILLAAGLFIGSPIEFLDITVDRIMKIVLVLVILFCFYRLFRLSGVIEIKIIKWVTRFLIVILFILYLLNGFWTVYTTSDYYPKWKDLEVYTNKNGQKVISESRETSPTVYDYRNRKILLENNQFRISTDFPEEKMDGVWTVHDIVKDSTYSIDIDKKR